MTELRNQPAFRTGLVVCAMALLCVFCGFLPELTEADARQILPLALALIVLAAVTLALTKKLTASRAVLLLFAAGVLLRLTYALYTPYTVRQHDVWLVTSDKGHMAYIQHFATTLAPPLTNQTWQFSHPPLHHLLAGQLYRLLAAAGLTPALIAEKLQLLTAFYSCALMAVCDRLFCRCGLKNGARVLANAVVAFHPTFFLMGGCLNNDMLCLLLSVCALAYFAAWWQKSTAAPLLLCGACLGLAMMAKVSAALLAFPLGAAFLTRLFTAKATGGRARLFRQYALFAAVSVPLGMWFPLRNLVRFAQPLGYVAALSPKANASQYLAGIPATRRLFSFPLTQLKSPFQSWDPSDPGCNLFSGLFKTAVFGEGKWGGGVFCFVLLYSSVLLALCGFFYLAWQAGGTLTSARKNGLSTVWFGFTAVSLVSFVAFCFAYPFICSEDFRYLAATLPLGALSLGQLYQSKKQQTSRVLRGLLIAAVTLFSVSSAIVYALPNTIY